MPRKEIESFNAGLATLSIEELEERLETQVLRAPEASCDWSCNWNCASAFACEAVGAHCALGFTCGDFCS